MKDRFVEIYTTNEWGKGSGEGSFEIHTRGYRKFLQHFLKERKITSVIDMGCGDWQFSKYINWDGITYLGYDIVPQVISTNIKQYSQDNVSFKLYSGNPDELPKGDLLIAKDVLQHLSNETILQFLAYLSNYKYVLITNCTNPMNGSLVNDDIPNGGFRYLDLRLPPFNLKARKVYSFKKNEKSITDRLKTLKRGHPIWRKLVLLVDNSHFLRSST